MNPSSVCFPDAINIIWIHLLNFSLLHREADLADASLCSLHPHTSFLCGTRGRFQRQGGTETNVHRNYAVVRAPQQSTTTKPSQSDQSLTDKKKSHRATNEHKTEDKHETMGIHEQHHRGPTTKKNIKSGLGRVTNWARAENPSRCRGLRRRDQRQ